MKKIYLPLFVVSILLSCSQQKVVENAMIDTVSTSSELSEHILDSTNNFIQRDSLLIEWDNHLLDITNSNLNFNSEKKSELNKYVPGQIDTIEHLTFKESDVWVYHTIDKNILMSSDIRNPEIPLSKEIKVGVSRSELQKALNTGSNNDTITVTDFEGNTNVTLILKNNILSRIIYCAYVE